MCDNNLNNSNYEFINKEREIKNILDKYNTHLSMTLSNCDYRDLILRLNIDELIYGLEKRKNYVL